MLLVKRDNHKILSLKGRNIIAWFKEANDHYYYVYRGGLKHVYITKNCKWREINNKDFPVR